MKLFLSPEDGSVATDGNGIGNLILMICYFIGVPGVVVLVVLGLLGKLG